MKLQKIIISALLVGGIFTLSTQAQLPQDQGVLRSARRAENERENFELINNSNADIYYSVGVENDPVLYAQNFRLTPPLRPLGIIHGVVPTNQRVEVIATTQEPGNQPYTVRLFSFTPGKDIFVQTVNKGGVIYIEPQSPQYLGLFGKSKTGRDLGNNVKQSDIRFRDIIYTPKTRYTPPQYTPEQLVYAVFQKAPNIGNDLKTIIKRIVDPNSTIFDVLGLNPNTARPNDVADAHQALVIALDDLNIPEAQELIKRVNNLVNNYFQRQQPPQTGALVPVSVRPEQPRPQMPVIPAQALQNTDILRILNSGTLLDALNLNQTAIANPKLVDESYRNFRDTLIPNTTSVTPQDRQLALKTLAELYQRYQAIITLADRIRKGETIFNMLPDLQQGASEQAVSEAANDAVNQLERSNIAGSNDLIKKLRDAQGEYLESLRQPAPVARPESQLHIPPSRPQEATARELARLVMNNDTLTNMLGLPSTASLSDVQTALKFYRDMLANSNISNKKEVITKLSKASEQYQKTLFAATPTPPAVPTPTPIAQQGQIKPGPAVRQAVSLLPEVTPTPIVRQTQPIPTPIPIGQETLPGPQRGTAQAEKLPVPYIPTPGQVQTIPAPTPQQVQVEPGPVAQQAVRLPGSAQPQAPMEYVTPAPGGLTNEEVARILKAGLSYQILGINEASNLAKQRAAFNDLANRSRSTNFIRQEDKNKVLENLIRVGDIIDSRLRLRSIAATLSREESEESANIESTIKAMKDMTAFLKQQQSELNKAFDEYLKRTSSEEQRKAGQPSSSRQSSAQPPAPIVQPAPVSQPTPRSIPEATALTDQEIQKILNATAAPDVIGQRVNMTERLKALREFIARAKITKFTSEADKTQVLNKLQGFYDKLAAAPAGELNRQLTSLTNESLSNDEKRNIINKIVNRLRSAPTNIEPYLILELKPDATAQDAENRLEELKQVIKDFVEPVDPQSAGVLNSIFQTAFNRYRSSL